MCGQRSSSELDVFRLDWCNTGKGGVALRSWPIHSPPHTHIHTCTHTHAHTQAHTQARTLAHGRTRASTCTRTHARKHVHANTHAQAGSCFRKGLFRLCVPAVCLIRRSWRTALLHQRIPSSIRKKSPTLLSAGSHARTNVLHRRTRTAVQTALSPVRVLCELASPCRVGPQA